MVLQVEPAPELPSSAPFNGAAAHAVGAAFPPAAAQAGATAAPKQPKSKKKAKNAAHKDKDLPGDVQAVPVPNGESSKHEQGKSGRGKSSKGTKAKTSAPKVVPTISSVSKEVRFMSSSCVLTQSIQHPSYKQSNVLFCNQVFAC
jgi:hypothetical protein